MKIKNAAQVELDQLKEKVLEENKNKEHNKIFILNAVLVASINYKEESYFIITSKLKSLFAEHLIPLDQQLDITLAALAILGTRLVVLSHTARSYYNLKDSCCAIAGMKGE